MRSASVRTVSACFFPARGFITSIAFIPRRMGG